MKIKSFITFFIIYVVVIFIGENLPLGINLQFTYLMGAVVGMASISRNED